MSKINEFINTLDRLHDMAVDGLERLELLETLSKDLQTEILGLKDRVKLLEKNWE